jgi:histidinol-phosphate aminotransferase
MSGAVPRAGLRDVAPYVSPQLEVAARLNTNECPHPLPEGFFSELAHTVRDLPLHRYPDGQMSRLRDELAQVHGHTPDGTWVANGSNEILTQLLQAYGGPGRSAAVFEPTYVLHSRLSWLTHTGIQRLTLPDGFVATSTQVEEAAARTPDVVFVCSPNNPTGNAQPVEVVRAIAERLPESLVIVDEAYGEFAPNTTALPLVAEHPNVAVVRTFSKAFALAGARIGYVLAAPVVVEDLQRVRLPYHLSALTQAAAIIALRHRTEAFQLLGAIAEQRDRLVAGLGALPGMTVYPSDANFVLFVPPGDARQVWQGLLDRGVLVRDMTAVVPNALRVTAGAEHEVDLFLKALKEVLGP